ncbi:molybdopterin-dependent oxidoreductase [Chthonobacter albigriseus]|uniref:molybdopterin-dependent oxidoreductase n=1 Tax=Chthonobacter albigriseus TaxID=1683161 RepID=UPI001FCE9419|nr:molybdopterin-dependent oxidoreductase [Chthonobacter albigriseus]
MMLKPILASAALLALSAFPAAALDAPKGEVILVVKGAITNTNGPDGASFDMAMLDALASRTTSTATPWVEGKVDFKGPLGSAILDAVGATGTSMTVTALNDYSVEVPVADFREHEVILATTLNGEPMSVRDKGPLFIIYPFDSEPQLYNELYFSRSVWQIATIDVK